MKCKITTVMVLLAICIAIGQIAFADTAEYAYLVQVTGTRFLPSSAYAGDTISIALDVKNKGSMYSIQDLNASMSASSQFDEVKVSDYANSIAPAETKTLVMKLRAKEDTLPGYYPALITFNYARNGKSTKEDYNISIPISKAEKNIDVTITPEVISPGNKAKSVFTLRNVGGTPVSNITLSWAETNKLILPIGTDNKRYINSIEPGESTEVSYTIAVDPNITTGIYPIDVTLSFVDSNGPRAQSSQVGLIIGGKTDFEISAEVINGTQLSVSIANIGSNNAGAVVAKIPQQPGLSVSGSGTSILGNLNKGDFTIASFQLQQGTGMQSQQTGQQVAVPSGQAIHGTGTLQGQQSDSMQGSQDQQQFQRRAFGQDFNGLRGMRQAQSTQGIIEIDYTDTTGERQKAVKTFQLNQGASSPLAQGAARQRQDSGTGFLQIALPAAIIIGALGFNALRAKKAWMSLARIIAATIALFLAATFLLRAETIALGAAAVASIAMLAAFFSHGLAEKAISKIRGGH